MKTREDQIAYLKKHGEKHCIRVSNLENLLANQLNCLYENCYDAEENYIIRNHKYYPKSEEPTIRKTFKIFAALILFAMAFVVFVTVFYLIGQIL